MLHNSTILGIDPGYGRMGLAVVESKNKNPFLIYSECFETDSKNSHSKRLSAIGRKVQKVIEKYRPERVALETLLWSKNVKTALQVAEARGVILSEAAKKNIPVREFNPNQIKLAVTGYGKSDKQQVINMVEKLVKLDSKRKRRDDEYDAIAIALTCVAISLSTDLLA